MHEVDKKIIYWHIYVYVLVTQALHTFFDLSLFLYFSFSLHECKLCIAFGIDNGIKYIISTYIYAKCIYSFICMWNIIDKKKVVTFSYSLLIQVLFVRGEHVSSFLWLYASQSTRIYTYYYAIIIIVIKICHTSHFCCS